MKYVNAIVIPVVLVYGMFWFITWERHPFEWGDGGRLFFVVCSTVGVAIAVLALLSWEDM